MLRQVFWWTRGRCGVRSMLLAAAWSSVAMAQTPREPAQAVTFNRDVAPILHAHCVVCHHPGAAGPFSLVTFADARTRARLIATVTARRVMPPWQPLPVGPAMRGARRLSDAEVRVLQQWVDSGALEGDPVDRRTPPALAPGWHLGEPDLVVSMAVPFELAAGGADSFRNLVLPVPITGRRYVQAVELRPGNPKVIHHARVMVDTTGASRRQDDLDAAPGYPGMDTPGARFPDGYFLGWAAGKVPKREASSWSLEPGTDLVVQLHLRPTGRVEPVTFSVGLYFTETPPPFTPAVLQMGARTLDIAAGERAYVVDDSYVLPVDVKALRIAPHAHYLGREMVVRATPPGREPITLLHIPDWDFNWQDDYDYEQPVTLPAGTRVDLRFTFDNSSDNPRNPHAPPQRVAFGSQATDEMCELLVQLVPARAADLPRLQESIYRKTLEVETAELQKRVADRPADVEARLSLGNIYMQTSRWDDGAREFESAVRLGPDHAIANYNAGQVAFARRDYVTARQRLERATALKADLVEGHTTLGIILEMQGEADNARRHYRAALATRPGHLPAATNLARSLMRAGEWRGAVSVLERTLRERPAEPALLELLNQATSGAAAAPTEAPVLDLDGTPVVLTSPGVKATVLLFVGTDCPVSNRYAPEVRRLSEQFSKAGVSFVTVYPNPAETTASIRQHLREYRLPPRAVHDAAQRLVARSGATITPEVAVYDRGGRLVYRGRIDDRYPRIGVERASPTRRDLQEVLTALAAGQTPALRTTEAVGCFIADLAP